MRHHHYKISWHNEQHPLNNAHITMTTAGTDTPTEQLYGAVAKKNQQRRQHLPDNACGFVSTDGCCNPNYICQGESPTEVGVTWCIF